jgi:hypothetical protein
MVSMRIEDIDCFTIFVYHFIVFASICIYMVIIELAYKLFKFIRINIKMKFNFFIKSKNFTHLFGHLPFYQFLHFHSIISFFHIFLYQFSDSHIKLILFFNMPSFRRHVLDPIFTTFEFKHLCNITLPLIFLFHFVHKNMIVISFFSSDSFHLIFVIRKLI